EPLLTAWLCAAPQRAAPHATSRRTAHRAASPRSTRRAGSRRAGSSCGCLLGEKRGEIDRVALQLGEKYQQPMIGHALRVEDAIEVVAFVLHDAGVKAFDITLDDLAVETGPAIAHPQMARHDPAQPGNRQAALPAKRPLRPKELDDRVDQHRQIL